MTSKNLIVGREETMAISAIHAVNQENITRSLQSNEERIIVGMGSFWGAERKFWNTDGVVFTSVGYAGGSTKNPTYDEVCSGNTGHAEVVNIVFDNTLTSLAAILTVFWENHDPTQGMRQGNDLGTQYRSAIYPTTDAQMALVKKSITAYQTKLHAAGLGNITTECCLLNDYYFAEEYHQQYLHKNPAGYCGLGGTGVSCPIGVLA